MAMRLPFRLTENGLSALRWKQVLRPRRGIRKCEGRLLDLSVRPRQAAAMMLAHVLLPGRNAEHLDKAIRSLGVPVQLPARRPDSESTPAKLSHRLQEGQRQLRRDGERDRAPYRSGLGLWV